MEVSEMTEAEKQEIDEAIRHTMIKSGELETPCADCKHSVMFVCSGYGTDFFCMIENQKLPGWMQRVNSVLWVRVGGRLLSHSETHDKCYDWEKLENEENFFDFLVGGLLSLLFIWWWPKLCKYVLKKTKENENSLDKEKEISYLEK